MIFFFYTAALIRFVATASKNETVLNDIDYVVSATFDLHTTIKTDMYDYDYDDVATVPITFFPREEWRVKYVNWSLYDEYDCNAMITAGTCLQPHIALFLTMMILYYVVVTFQ